MKSNVFKFNSVLLFLILTVTVNGQSYTKENTIVRSFALSDDTEVEIINKYGDINIENWEKDSVKIIINYKVTSTKGSKLQKTFDAINFDFKANDYYVVVRTTFEGKGSFWSDVSEIAGNLFAAGTHTSIDYTVYVPHNRHLNLNLKYGNVYATNHTGFLKLALSNGDFKAHNLSGENELEIMFGNATINSISKGTVKVSYGEFNLDNADVIAVTGQSSEFELGKINELKLDSKRDKINVEEVKVVSGITYFSRLNIQKLNNKFDVSARYGSIKLRDFSSAIDGVHLSSYNTSVSYYFQKGKNYNIKITSDDKADVTYSANLGEFSTKSLEGKEKLMQANCIMGSNENAVPVIFDIKSGLLTLKASE